MAKKKKSYKRFKNELRRVQHKTNNRRERTPENPSQENAAKVQGKEGTRIGGSTAYVLPEPRAGGISSIERIDTPPPPEQDF